MNFTVADPSAIGGVNVAVTADDGAVVYVNGNEVARQRMGDGTVDASTFASASVSTPSARADRQLVFVPADKLVAGANTLAVETHLNYRSSSSMTIDGMVKVVTKGDEPAPEPRARSGAGTPAAAGSSAHARPGQAARGPRRVCA